MEEKFYLDSSRIPVFIGKNGEMKARFEEEFSCSIEVDSQNGEVTVISEEALDTFVLGHAIEAINLGHNPEHTFMLADEHFVLDIIDVKSMVRDSKRLQSVMGRVIGKDGSTRRAIEEITKCWVAVVEEKVSVIGPFENVQLVHEALDMLISGASHKSIYSYLERNRPIKKTEL